ncbi:uncharacterized protein CCR75_002398 [Bremia lactucae]|uniref:Uncharacterized protein n=1 Tax=Bremia lactucae TaxID=4779 RepID=A0A976IKB8_BRELC|nr:hypothetical protein CCR75_006646 [Bremia lactucae]TDH73371.1 hypothetical protein CCR75_002398 [Bremia lactucae]
MNAPPTLPWNKQKQPFRIALITKTSKVLSAVIFNSKNEWHEKYQEAQKIDVRSHFFDAHTQ